jgi:hypothetical protein
LLKRQDFQPLCQHDTDMNSISRGKGWGEGDSKQGRNPGSNSNELISNSLTSTLRDFLEEFLETTVSEVGNDASPNI